MNNQKHTEWTWYNGCSWWRLGTVEGNGTKETLIMYPTIDRDGHPNIVISEGDRDLIATAPELLEACKKAYEALTNIEQYGQHKDNPLPTILRQAIKRAEGKQGDTGIYFLTKIL